MTAISLGNLFDSAMQAFALGTSATRQAEPVASTETEAESSNDPMKDYIVELSEAARKLAESENPYTKVLNRASGATGAGEEEGEDLSLAQQLKERIKQVQQEILELQNDASLSPEAKQLKLAVKQTELAGLQSQLQEALKAEQGLDGLLARGSLT